MEKKKKIKLGTIINIIAIIVILILLIILFNNNDKLIKANSETNKINGINKEAITAEEFKNIISEKGFNINILEDVLDTKLTTKAGMKKGYITEKQDDKEYRINFFEFEDENSEQYMYYDAINKVRDEGNWNITETIDKSMKHTKYTALTNGNYIVVSRINNTLIWATISADKKQNLIDLLNEIGY